MFNGADQLQRKLSTAPDHYQLAFPDDESFPDDSAEAAPVTNGNGHVDDDITGLNAQVQRVVTENMVLHNKINKQADQLKKLRDKRSNGANHVANGEIAIEQMDDSDLVRLETVPSATASHSGLLEVFDVNEFVRVLVADLHPRVARLLAPCHPSYLLLMALRLYDNTTDEAGMAALFGATHSALRDIFAVSLVGKVVDLVMTMVVGSKPLEHSSDLDLLCLWLVNIWRLLNLLRQYAAEDRPEWTNRNTTRQNEHRLKHFNTEPIREKLYARCSDAYETLMKRCIEPLLTPKIIPAILLHNAAHEFPAPTDKTGFRSQQNAFAAQERLAEYALDDLIQFLSVLHDHLTKFGADEVLLHQCFNQLAKWLCAQSVNHLMFRKDMCNFERAVQIKHNVQEIQSWLSDKNLDECRIHLEPLIQASHLLQAPKDMAHVDKIVTDMTDKLNTQQILTILRHYTPLEVGYEEGAVSPEVLNLVQFRLKERQFNPDSPDANETAEEFYLPKPALMSTHLTPIDLEPFVYSDVNLQNVTLPKCLHIDDVVRVL